MICFLFELMEMCYNMIFEEIKYMMVDVFCDISLVNLLVIGIVGVCLLFLIVLVVVGVMFR